MDHTRHIGLFNASSLSATLIGCGGIGASTALALAKMGIGYLTLIDDDVVSDVNLPVQFHRLSDVGKPKAEAVMEMVRTFADDTYMQALVERVDGTDKLNDQIVISAVDSITARHAIWEEVKAGQPRFYLDARMAAEEFHLYCVDMNDTDWYERMLSEQSDGAVPEIACTMKATIYTSFIAAGTIAGAVKRIATGKPLPRILVHHIANNFLMSQE